MNQPAAITDLARPRRSTLETFNDEMAVLDRPLESDVEYYDEKRPSRLRGKASMLVGIVAIGAASGLVFVKVRSNAAATEASAAAPAAAAPAAPAPAAAPSPAIAAAAPAAPSPATAAAPGSDESADAPADDPAVDDSAPRASSRAAWAKIRTKTTHSRHERSGGGGKVVYRRTTTVKRHVVVKRTVAGRR
jgi:hypothetical protein